jgi:hypothetical protein
MPNTLPKPFTGLHAGSVGDATQHGYGMSAFVKYIVKKYSQSILVNIYQKILDGRHVFDAINNSINYNLFMDYNPFLQQYAQGQIYSDLSQDILVNMRDDTFQIETDKDTLKTFTANYKELSAKLYLVRLDYQSFKDDATLEISIDQDLCDITVFQYPKTGGAVSILAKDQKSCVVSDLKGLQKEKHLIVMVTNSNYTSNNYAPSNKNINVTIKVKNTKIVGVNVEIFIDNIKNNEYNDVDGWYTDNNAYFSGQFSSGIYGSGSDLGSGSINNNVYSGTFDNHRPDEWSVSGNMKITFLEDPRRIDVNIDIVININSINYTGTDRLKFNYNGVPYFMSYESIQDYTDYYSETGSSVSKISMSYSHDGTGWDGIDYKTRYISHGTCSTDAYIRVDAYYK